MNLNTSYEEELDRYFTNYRKYKEMSKYFTGKEKEILLTLSNGFKQETKTILKKVYLEVKEIEGKKNGTN